MSENFYRTECSPNDSDMLGSCDSESIQNAIDGAVRLGINKVVIPRYNKRTHSFQWLITKTIKVPSFMNIVLDNCHMHLAEGVSCSIFANELAFADERNTLAGEQEGICICGTGTAVLDGINCDTLDGTGPAVHNSIVYLRNVKDIKISDIVIRNHRSGGLGFCYCRYATVRNITVQSKDPSSRQAAMELGKGCNNFMIENVTGNGGSTLVMAAINQGVQLVMGKDPDIHDIMARNLKGDAPGNCIVALRNRDENKLYNILLDGVTDISVPYSADCPAWGVKIGETGSTRQCNRMGDIKNITVRNVFFRGTHAVSVDAALMNSYISNIHVFADGLNAIGTCQGADFKNVHVEGVFYHPEQESNGKQQPGAYSGCAFQLTGSTSENFTVKSVFVENAAHVACLTGGIQMKISGLYGSNIIGDPVEKDEGSEMVLC